MVDSTSLRTGKLSSLVFNRFIRWQPPEDSPKFARWQRRWEQACKRFSGPVDTVIHGRPVIVNFGYTYPLYARRFPDLNNPLVELVHQAHRAAGRPLTVIDVGAAVGDTVLLIQANCPGAVARWHCVDGDPEFFPYLTHNLRHLTACTYSNVLLSGEARQERELVRTHAGTASAQGRRLTTATTFDAMARELKLDTIDVLKIDVDGLDGQVLAGAVQTLTRQQPAVIFEWHPRLCHETGNSAAEHFQILRSCDYTTFVWFTKFGAWSHIVCAADPAGLALMIEFALQTRTRWDWHYDIVALHANSQISPCELADLEFAQRRPSRY